MNFFLIKNLYDSLIEYPPEGEPVPSLAIEWSIADDNPSVAVTLREGVTFHSGNTFEADAVAATLAKAASPEKGKNVYATMSIVKAWTLDDPQTITLNFTNPVPDRQMLDLLHFLLPIHPPGIDTVETTPGRTGPFMLENRAIG